MMISTYFFPIAMAIAIAENFEDITEGAYPNLAQGIGLGAYFSILRLVNPSTQIVMLFQL